MPDTQGSERLRDTVCVGTSTWYNTSWRPATASRQGTGEKLSKMAPSGSEVTDSGQASQPHLWPLWLPLPVHKLYRQRRAHHSMRGAGCMDEGGRGKGSRETGSPQKLLQQGSHVGDLPPLEGEAATAETGLCLLHDGADARGRAGDPEKTLLSKAVLLEERQHLRWGGTGQEGSSEGGHQKGGGTADQLVSGDLQTHSTGGQEVNSPARDFIFSTLNWTFN